MSKMKISLYIRVSTEDQAKEGYSLEVQREYLEIETASIFCRSGWLGCFRAASQKCERAWLPRYKVSLAE